MNLKKSFLNSILGNWDWGVRWGVYSDLSWRIEIFISWFLYVKFCEIMLNRFNSKNKGDERQSSESISDPLDIFAVIYDANLFSVFNSISLQMFFDLFLFIFIFKIIFLNVDTFKNYDFYFIKTLYSFIWNLFKNLVTNLRLERFFFIITTYLLCVCTLNLGGFSFYELSFTSHISLTFFLSFSIFINFVFNMFVNFNEFVFFKFVQKTNVILVPFLFVIEIVSFLIRPLSLSIRLFANIMSGHVLMHMFLSAFAFFYKSIFWLSVIIFIFCVLIFFMELFVSLIQSYIFVVLLLVYSRDSVDLH